MSADSFLLKRPLQPQDIQSGLLRDLQPFLEADAAFHPEDLYPGLLDRLRWQGRLWGLPAPGTPLLLFYDKAAFDQAGLLYPQPGWSFDEFETAARAMTRGQGEETVRYGLVVSPHSLTVPILVLGRAEDWAEGVSTLPEPILGAPAVVEAAQWFVNLADEGVMPNPYELQDGTTPFIVREVEEGRAAMWDGWPNAYMREAYEKVYDLGVAPFPEGVPVSNWVGGGVYAMSAGTAHPDEVWQWLRFLTYQEGDVQEVRPPVRRSVAEGSGYWEKLGAELSAVVRYIMERSKVALPPGMVGSLQTALKAILSEGQSVEESLARAQRELAEALGTPVAEAAPPPIIPTVAPSQEQVAIDYCSMAVAPELHQSLRESFQKSHPEITIHILDPDVDSVEEYVASCDCFDSLSFSLLNRADVWDLVQDLQPLVDADPGFPTDFYPGLLDIGRWHGELRSIPAYMDFRVIRYNKDLFDQANVPYPRPGWTTDEFYEIATALARHGGEGQRYSYWPDYGFGRLPDIDHFVEQRGGFADYKEIEALTGVAPLKAPETRAAMQWYTRLALTDKAMPPFPPAGDYEGDFERQYGALLAGQVAMWGERGGYSFSGLSYSTGIAPLPLDNNMMRQYYPIVYMISAQAPHPQACWTWIRFLLDQPAAAVGGVPARQSLFQDPAFVKTMGEERTATYRFILEHIAPVPWRSNVFLHRAFEAVMQGTDTETAVEKALRQDQTFHTCLSGVSGPLTDEEIAACLEKVGLAPFP